MAARAPAAVDVLDRDLERAAAVVPPARTPDVEPPAQVPLSNGAVSRLVQRVQAAPLRVSDPGDPAEREAHAISQLVLRAPAPPPPPAPVALQREPVGGATAGTGDQTTSTGGSVEGLIASPGAGEPIDPAVQARIQPVLGADLGPVRVHQGPAPAAAAAALQARAFTSGAHVFLGAGESTTDVGLMAHEATHTVQQQAVDVLRSIDVQRDFSISGAAMSAVHAAAEEIPGYGLLAQVVGRDPLTDEPVTTPRTGFLQALLTYGPFAGAVGPALQALDVLDEVFTLVTSRLAQHHLTWSRVQHDFAAAWDEVKLVEGVDYNVRIIARYVDALLADVRAFVVSIVDDVLAAVRAAVVSAVEPLVQTPQIKPWWDLAVKVFHHDPLRGVAVAAPTVEILGDFLRLIGKEAALAQMTERGTLQRTADWLDTQMARFTGLLARATQLFADAWAAISPQNLPNLLSSLRPLADRAYALVHDVGAFASDVAVQVLALIKTSLLGWLASHADGVRGFRLLTVILGRNPFTGETVPRTAENLVHGFIALLPGGEATYAQLAQSGVIADAATRIESAMTRLGITWEMVTGTFRAIWDTLSLEDLLAPIAAFERIVNQFGEPLGRIVEFVSVVVQVVVELVLRVMNFPSELLGHIVDNAMAAIADIENDPVAFLLNVVAALKAGFAGFFEHVVQYLLSGLTSWLFRGLRSLGIEPPTSVSVQSVITLLIQVLGFSVEMLWTKLGERIGPERVAMIRGAVDRLGEAWGFVKDVQERGITAIWEFISGQLSNLWDTILQAAKDWIMREIVDKVTAKLLSMLDPTGIMAVINGTVAFFRAVQSAIDYLREILQIVDEYVATIAAVAKGQIAPGAAKIEHGLGDAMPVAIGFLAAQVGLGDAPEKVRDIILDLRALFDQAVSWLFDQAMRLGQAALAALGFGPEQPTADPDHDRKVAEGLAALRAEEGARATGGRLTYDAAQAVATTIKTQHPIFTALDVVDGGQTWDFRYAASPVVTDTGLGKADSLSLDPGVPVPSEISVNHAGRYVPATLMRVAPVADYGGAVMVECHLVAGGRTFTRIDVFRDELANTAGKAKPLYKTAAQHRADVVAIIPTFPRLVVGPHAQASIAVTAIGQPPTSAENAAIQPLGDAHGCHTCGTHDPGPGGRWHADHQPASGLLPLLPAGTTQRFYPQCESCSDAQGADVRAIRDIYDGLRAMPA